MAGHKKTNRTKLLIVDDNSNNRAAISYWLDEEDYEILHAMDGTSALKIIETFVPDIILLDYNLPGIDGIEVCQKIRSNKNLPFIPIIMMSSYAPEAHVIALEQGVDEFIPMPIMPTEIKSRLRAMLRLKQAVSESLKLSSENKKLQELDKIKSNFISKVSHELKTPMQSILGYTEILKEGLQGELNFPQKLMVKQIREAGEQLLDLINQLLDFEITEKEEMLMLTKVFNIESVFNYLSQIVNPIATKKNIKLDFTLENKNIQLESNKEIVQKILLNIISNSIKFSNNNSTILISAKELQNEVEFKVIDNGQGIAKLNIAYIFDKFWQEDESITRTHGGLGIGLTLVKKLVTKLNGRIIVDSKPNKGTIFKVILPKEFKDNLEKSHSELENVG